MSRKPGFCDVKSQWLRGIGAWGFLLMALVGCTQAPSGEESPGEAVSASPDAPPPANLPQVVATTTVLCDLTEQIAGPAIDLTCLMEPGEDPHVYEPTPSDRRAIEEADLVLYGGYNFEPDLIQIIQATTSPSPKVAVYELAVPEPLMGEGHDHDHDHSGEHGEEYGGGEEHEHDTSEEHLHENEQEDEHDHDHDHAHGDTISELVPDPHVWHSAMNGVAIANVIQTELSNLLPEQASVFQQNADGLTTELTDLHNWIISATNTVPTSARMLVTTHDSFSYFAEAYDFTVKGALTGLSTEESPSAARLAELVDQVKAAEVQAIFAESTSNSQLIEAIARDAGVAVGEYPLLVEGPSGPGTDAPTYQLMLVYNTCSIVNALGGQCDVNSAPIQ